MQGRIVVTIGWVMAENISIKTGDRTEILITDWRFLLRETRKIEPRAIAKFKAKALDIGRPVDNAVKRGISNRFPITGMERKVVPGRTTWGGNNVPVKQTRLQVNTKIYKKGKSIVSVWVDSPAVVIADMANRRGPSKITREYEYSRSATGKRRHRVNGQGSAMVQALRASTQVKKRDVSRIVYPSAEKALPQVNAKMIGLIESMSERINAEIVRAS